MPSANTDRQKKLNAAYGAASQRLREENLKRFNTLYAEEAKQRGVEWSPRKTREEKAEETLLALLSEHPNLRSKVAEIAPEVATSQASGGTKDE